MGVINLLIRKLNRQTNPKLFYEDILCMNNIKIWAREYYKQLETCTKRMQYGQRLTN
jgi:hypothetical protein